MQQLILPPMTVLLVPVQNRSKNLSRPGKLAMKHENFGQKLQPISGILNCKGVPSCIHECTQVCRQVQTLYPGLDVLSRTLPALLLCSNRQIFCQGHHVMSALEQDLAATAS